MKESLNPAICVWCVNKIRDVCDQCQDEGRYRFLDPAPLAHYELPPELPPFRDLLNLPAVERLALFVIYSVVLSVHRTTFHT